MSSPRRNPLPRWKGFNLVNEPPSPSAEGMTREGHAKGIGVHCGEGGAVNRTPHDIVLRWLGDVLDILKDHRIGFALWNSHGSFGILDSGRTDVAYEDWHGLKLDRPLLELLRSQ